MIWTIFIFYEVFMIGLIRGSFGRPENYILHYALNIGLFYFHAEFVLTYWFSFKKIKALIVVWLIALELVLYILLVLIMDWNLSKYTTILGPEKISVNKQLFLGYIWRGLYFILFGSGYYFLKKSISERDEKEQINTRRLEGLIEHQKTEKELAIAKNAFLLAQVNPHFLFNTLNFIYYKTYKDSPDGAKAILGLSKIMHYATKVLTSTNNTTYLEEIEHIENILEINRLRHGNKMVLVFNYDNKVLHLNIIPLVLITIVENIFKHGYLTQSAYPAYFSINLIPNFVLVSSGNLSKASKNLTGLNSGLKNIAERLNYEYGKNASMEYSVDTNNFFSLKLFIPLVYNSKNN